MAAQNLLMMDFLRILTPEEINDLTMNTVSDTRVSLTEVLEEKISGNISDVLDETSGGAKILPFKRRGEDTEVEAIELKMGIGEHVTELLNQYKKDPLKFIYVPPHKRETLYTKDGKMRDTSTFILNEKERFQILQERLKGKEIVELYAETSKVQAGGGQKKSSHVGILINKKQA